MARSFVSRAAAPVDFVKTGSRFDDADHAEPGIALCLSGGGYRAMLFHAGALWCLHDHGLLGTVRRIASVSGSSIVAALLGLRWRHLHMKAGQARADLWPQVIEPLLRLADVTIAGFPESTSISSALARALDERLFEGATLQDLADSPRFLLNATNVQSGALWRFSKAYQGDWRVGLVSQPALPIALAVAASAARPPDFPPVTLDLDPHDFVRESGAESGTTPAATRVALADGGVCDPLALETTWKRFSTLLVGDAGARVPPEVEPDVSGSRHVLRVLELLDRGLRDVRKRQLLDSFVGRARHGAYWSIRTTIGEYPAQQTLHCPPERTAALAAIPTRFERLDPVVQERLVNWGYAIADAAVRSHAAPSLLAPTEFPFPASAV